MNAPRLETQRLILRARRLEDFPAFAAMWADPRTVQHFASGPMSREDSWTAFARSEGLWALQGFSLWILEEKASGAFVGEAGGFDRKRDLEPSLDGLLEFGWSLAPAFQGRGYAREAVNACAAWADAHCPHAQHIAIIATTNEPSMRVAEATGFRLAGPMDFKGRTVWKYLRPRGGDGGSGGV